MLVVTFTSTCGHTYWTCKSIDVCQRLGHPMLISINLQHNQRVSSSTHQHLSNLLMTSTATLGKGSRVLWMRTMVLIPFLAKFYKMQRSTPALSWHSALSYSLVAIPISRSFHHFSSSTQSMMSDLHCKDVYPSFWFLRMTMTISAHTMLPYKISSLIATEDRIVFLTLSSVMGLLWMAAFIWLHPTSQAMLLVSTMLIGTGVITFICHFLMHKILTTSSIWALGWSNCWTIYSRSWIPGFVVCITQMLWN